MGGLKTDEVDDDDDDDVDDFLRDTVVAVSALDLWRRRKLRLDDPSALREVSTVAGS